MVAAANTALSATADGNQKKPGLPGFIPPGANPQQVAAALAARPAPNVLAGTGLGMGDPMKQIAPIAPAVGGGLAPAFGSGLYGPNARYNALPQDNAKNAGRVGAADVPIQASKMGWNDITPLRAPEGARNIYANMGVDDLKSRANLTGVQSTPQAPATAQQPALAGLAAMEVNNPAPPAPAATAYRNEGQNVPAPQAAPSEYSRQMGSVANFFGDAASGAVKTLVSAPGYGLSSTNTAAPPTAPAAQAAPAAPPYRNEGKNYPAGGKAQSPAVTTAPAGEPQRNASGALTSLGAGTDVVGAGIKKYVVDGKTLYSNMGDSGDGGNLSLMNRGAPTAQSMAAMDALAGRYAADTTQAVQRMQFNDQVAQAQAINARPNPEYTNPNDLRDPANIAARNQRMDMQIKSGESPQVYDARMRAIQESQRLAASQNNANADRGFNRDRLLAEQQIAQSRLGIDQQQLGLRQQQVGNELATGEQSRDAKGMEIAASKQLQSLRDRFMAATGAEQEAIGKQLQALAGKESRGDWKLQVTPATKNADGSTSAGSIVRYNERTGAVEQVAGGQGGQAATAGQKYEVGQTVVRADGAKARVLAVDESGKPTKFQPI